MKRKTILITGVAGFMGSHLGQRLAQEGHNVYGMDNLSTGRIENVPKKVKFIKCDLVNAKKVEHEINKIKPILVYHLAAWAHEGLSQFAPRLITENNYNAFLNLIVPCIKNNMERIVVTSSMSVYGDQKPPFNENMVKRPVDIYGIAKAAMEDSLKVLSDVHGFDYTIIRPHNVYGPGQSLWDPYRNVVAIFINRAMNNLPPIIYGDGNQTRAFSYIDDVNPYIVKAGLLNKTKGEIINVGPLEEYTINYLANVVLKTMNSNLKPKYVQDRPKEVKDAYCSNSKAKKLLGYKTTVRLEVGVERMVEWAMKLGPQKFRYLNELELTGKKIPKTWSSKLL